MLGINFQSVNHDSTYSIMKLWDQICTHVERDLSRVSGWAEVGKLIRRNSQITLKNIYSWFTICIPKKRLKMPTSMWME